MASILAAIEDDFVIQRTRLPRVTPFPTWNGTLASSSRNGMALVTVLSECGRVFVLRISTETPSRDAASILVHQVLEHESICDRMTMCQTWSVTGEWLVVACDQTIRLYQATPGGKLVLISHAVARFSVTAVAIFEDELGGLLITAGTTVGIALFSVERSEQTTEWKSLGSLLDEVAVAVLTASPDSSVLVVGTIDGRVIVLPRVAHGFGEPAFLKVLASPRVTSIAFSPFGERFIVATRKGNAYVLVKDSTTNEWRMDDGFESLVANPKGGADSQTLCSWWATSHSDATPIFIIGGRTSRRTLQLFDAYSRSHLHSLVLNQDNSSDGAKPPLQVHLMGVACVRRMSGEAAWLMCIDSEANIWLIRWPFLEYACPKYELNDNQ